MKSWKWVRSSCGGRAGGEHHAPCIGRGWCTRSMESIVEVGALQLRRAGRGRGSTGWHALVGAGAPAAWSRGRASGCAWGQLLCGRSRERSRERSQRPGRCARRHRRGAPPRLAAGVRLHLPARRPPAARLHTPQGSQQPAASSSPCSRPARAAARSAPYRQQYSSSRAPAAAQWQQRSGSGAAAAAAPRTHLEVRGRGGRQQVHQHRLAHAHAAVHVEPRHLGCRRRRGALLARGAAAKQARKPAAAGGRLRRGRGVHEGQAAALAQALGAAAQQVPQLAVQALDLGHRQLLPLVLQGAAPHSCILCPAGNTRRTSSGRRRRAGEGRWQPGTQARAAELCVHTPARQVVGTACM